MARTKKLTEEERAMLQAEDEFRQARRRNFRRELVGMFAGAGLAMAVGSQIPAIRENYQPGLVILLGAALGGTVVSLKRFERAGAILTKRDNRFLNYGVGLGIPFGILFLIFMLR